MRSTCARPALVLFATVLLSACTATGAGPGNDREGPDTRVEFSWSSEDAASGQVTATVPDGRSLVGKYFQISSDTQIDKLAPLWQGWGPEQSGWPFWYTQPGPQFVHYYGGRVLANLHAADGEPMWCSLRLLDPSSGMKGGGEGVCQLLGGTAIDVMFPRRSVPLKGVAGSRRPGHTAGRL